jgi:poly(glycerol-phosphate) alpha-glucosyltransferase
MEVHAIGLWDPDTEADAAAWGPVQVTTGQVQGPQGFGYSPTYHLALAKIQPDIVHVHGLWMYASAAALWWGAKTGAVCVVSPHGMLDRWALANAAIKKRIAGALYQDRHFRNSCCLHAVGEAEYQAIRDFGLRNPVCVIPNGVSLPGPDVEAPAWRAGLPADAQVLLYLGRLHPKKGLMNLLRAWAACATDPHRWHLVIAGWDTDGHGTELKDLAKSLDVTASVHFVGAQFGTDKAATFNAASAFVLPSLSEGLPVAVLEAWSYRLPVLMTPQCNLDVGFEVQAALPIQPDPQIIAHELQYLLRMGAAERAAMGDAGHRLVVRQFTWPSQAGRMAALYHRLLDQEALADCIHLDDGRSEPTSLSDP